jgi:hypothetical protein
MLHAVHKVHLKCGEIVRCDIAKTPPTSIGCLVAGAWIGNMFVSLIALYALVHSAEASEASARFLSQLVSFDAGVWRGAL